MKNYDEMSDFEINKLVAKLYLPCDYEFDNKSEKVDLVEYCTYLGAHGVPGERLEKYGEFNPCNNPSDAWQIILQCCMDLEFAHPSLGGVGTCTIYNEFGTDWQCDFTDNSKALRAAMICVLKMKDAES